MPQIEKDIMTELFEIQGYRATKIHKNRKEGFIGIFLERIGSSTGCLFPHKRYDHTVQRILLGSINGIAVYAFLKVYRTQCQVCGIKTEEQTISEGKKRYAQNLGRLVVEYTCCLDNKAAARLLGFSESTLFRIEKTELEEMLSRYRGNIPPSETLSVDEVSFKRRHQYATIVSDYDLSKVVWLEKDRLKSSLVKAYKEMEIKRVKNVAMDFWRAYERATIDKIPKALIIYDKFHLARILNKKIEEERRYYQSQLPKEEQRELKKHMRWLILKRRHNMTQPQQERFEALKVSNQPLYELALLKEDFLDIFQANKTKEKAKVEINQWIKIVKGTRFKKLKGFLKTLQKKMEYILNWFVCPISNGKAEGINNVIKTLLKRAYGYKNFDYFRLKVLQKCGILMDYATHTF